jgi:predicted ester cyclase
MTEANKKLVRRYYEEVLNQRNADRLDELTAANFTSYLANGASIGLSVYRQAVLGSLVAMPDLHVVINDQVSEGDKVVTRWTATGTPQVPFAGIQPGGTPITSTAIHIHRVEDERLVEHWEAINLHAVH